METRIFLHTLHEWLDAFEEQRFGDACKKSLDLWAVGHPLVKDVETPPNFAAPGSREPTPEELLEGLSGFLLALSIAADGWDLRPSAR